MELSRLKLEQYNLTGFSLDPIDGAEPVALGAYANPSDANFGSNTNFQTVQLENGEQRFTVELNLHAEPREGGTFPYRFKIALVGLFDGHDLPEERREPLVCVNGASMLYGVAREMLLGISHRFIHGPIMLPTVHFGSIGKDMENKSAVAKSEKGPSIPSS